MVKLGGMDMEVWSDDEIKNSIKKYVFITDEAHKRGVDVSEVQEKLKVALQNLHENNKAEAVENLIDIRHNLNENITNKFPGWDRYKFIFPMYGVWTLIYSLIWLVFAAAVLLIYEPKSLFLAVPNVEDPFEIPNWAPLFGAFGSSIQIIFGVASDVKHDGYVKAYRRNWYMALPFVGLVFGVLAYILYYIGLLSLQITDTKTENQVLLPLIICFLAGFSTDWFVDKLKAVTK